MRFIYAEVLRFSYADKADWENCTGVFHIPDLSDDIDQAINVLKKSVTEAAVHSKTFQNNP